MDLILGIIITTILGTVASISGVAIVVFNGTKKIILETSQTTKYIATLTEKHGEILNKLTETLNKQNETLNNQTEMLNRQTEMLNRQTEILAEMSKILQKQDETLARQAEILDRIDRTMVEEFRAIRLMLERIDKKIPEGGVYMVREK